jgi:molybdopterin-binding protein
MPREFYTASDAAQALGISLDTLRRWDRDGRIETSRDASNRRIVAATEIARLRGGDGERLSARNRFHGVVGEVKVEGLMAQVELLVTEPVRLVAVVTRDAVEDLGLKKGSPATAVVKSTSVMIQN